MSYIPKYILKRMVPKDAVKKNEDGTISIHIVNVISPISIDEMPEDDLLNYLEVLVDDEPVAAESLKELKLIVDEKPYGLENFQDLVGQTIPVGAKAQLNLPLDLEKGKTYKVDVTIKTDNPFNVSVKREVQ